MSFPNQVSSGDWILKIDEEDFSQMNMTVILEIITSKIEFERKLDFGPWGSGTKWTK